MSGDSIQKVVQPTVMENGEKAPELKFGQPRVMSAHVTSKNGYCGQEQA
jgi:hypothetical protein